ncbi:AHH domain-containing protein [Bacillus wiedmannii]|uniref:AHH domain-containing protein n=1 Tax=Bacillus wiedmannii TaxID=1890302 RepID=UPI0021CEBBEC|nr:AHH domain-containing protein [Bacillus wiedmannii]MCU5098006.1 AHH domain-containing protein [Bacillus wiedmannii]
MDVQYRPKDWVEMKDGLDQITKDTFVKLFDANRLLADTQGKIQDLDEDRSINFHYKDQTEIIAKLREAYTTLGKFCDEAGQAVYDAIDKPFFVQMDQFAQKMRDVSIKNFETTNRMGFTTITTVQGSSGYGETAQTIKTTKNTITVDDIFKESYAFDEVLRADYEERKRQDPTLKLDYEEYRKHIPSTRGFEYLSIEDDQKKLETWRDFGIGVITIGGLFICPPLGIAAGTVFGILEVKSAYDGEDWETHRKLDKEERVVRGVFGGLDAMSGAGSLMKSAKGIGTLVKLPGDGTNFNPNVGKNMVQSLRDNNTLKNTLIPVGVSWMDTAGIGIKMPVVRFSKVGEIGEDFTKARVIAKDDPYQHIKGSGGSGVSSEGSVVKGTGKTVSDYLDDIIVNGNVDAAKMNKLKNAIQNNTFSVDELSEISKKMSDLGINKEYNEALIKIDFGKYLRGLIGDPPAAMIKPHAHHILFKKGLRQKQQELVREGQEILRRYGIDPIIGKENLVWAPNAVIGQHSFDALENVVTRLRAVEFEGGELDDIVEALEELGELASRR